MPPLFSFDSIISLVTLVVLEIVLGIDNVIFVSILIGQLPPARQLDARRVWMVGGILVRSGLLLGLGWLINKGNRQLFAIAGHGFGIRDLVMLGGGIFLLIKTVREIHEKFEGDVQDVEEVQSAETPRSSFIGLVSQLILIDTLFSFDSVITAVGLAQRVSIMITAVVLAMIIMFFFSQRVADFINRRPTVKMLALSFLLMIGFSLFFEGLEPIHHMQIDKGYIYFAMAFSFGVELLNTRIRTRKKTGK
jgi:predicted tellurium resistance membrane protein TerC